MRTLATAMLVLALSAGLGLGGAESRQPVPLPQASSSPVEAAPPRHPIPYAAFAKTPKPHSKPIAAQTPATAAGPSPVSAATLAPAIPGARLSPGAAIPPEELAALVDGAVMQAMRADHIGGAAVSVVQNGQVVLDRGYGFAAPARPVDPDQTLFRLGDVSQVFTWIAVMKEVEAGRIRLGTPINLYLPERNQVRDQGFKRPILVRDLATHSAGFEDRVLGHLFEQDPRAIRPLTDYLREERPRRVREAGVWPSLDDYSAALAGQAVSWVENRPFQDVAAAQIFKPLGLAHTTFAEPYPGRPELPPPMPGALAAQVASGYRWTGDGLEPQPFEYTTQVAPALGASSTAADMARVMLMILNGGQLDNAVIYGPTTAQGLRTPVASGPGAAGWDDGFADYALPGGFRGQGLSGGSLWFRSRLIVVPALNLGVFVTANTDTGAALTRGLADQIVERFYVPPQPLPRPGSPSLADQAATYTGTYLTTRRAYGGLEKFVDLLSDRAKVSVTGDGRLLVRLRGALQIWTPQGPEGHFVRTDGPQTSAFDIEDGRATRWFAPSGGEVFERAGLLHRTRTLFAAAALALLTAIATLVGAAMRDRRESRQTPTQARADLIQITVALLWLAAVGLTTVWARGADDPGRLMYHWPGLPLMTASACALMASVLTLAALLMAPAVWRGGRRVDSWTAGRKLRFTLGVLVFAGFSVVLAMWGALEPWS